MHKNGEQVQDLLVKVVAHKLKFVGQVRVAIDRKILCTQLPLPRIFADSEEKAN
jgi:hypothetical protein